MKCCGNGSDKPELKSQLRHFLVVNLSNGFKACHPQHSSLKREVAWSATGLLKTPTVCNAEMNDAHKATYAWLASHEHRISFAGGERSDEEGYQFYDSSGCPKCVLDEH